ncbi:unnamed protein product [Rhizoctonia solani]|uniref:Uncharacterized protein n=2 Tax=Rhizoctonia solani TaxID=456999 RepID=A0A8H3HDU3_9AGAM|nr:hypothetical protein RSOL_435520 [Rhizoctonia solani AG-3 Rhs1AP]CAE6366422.1 unnamed protein product [Rhizoctonia solani]CAE6504008.1 unnamed protein product [Rhizoctonia solani]
MLGTRFHDDVHLGGRGQFGKTPGRINTNARKENPGGAQTVVRGKGGLGGSKVVLNNDAGPQETQRLFKDGKIAGQQAQSISKAFALLDKTNKTPHPKSRKPVSSMTPVAGSTKKPSLKPSFTPAPPQVTDDAPKATIRRPSAARLSIRAPRSGNFETPDARGRPAHWDVVDLGPSMDEQVQLSNDTEAKVTEVIDEEHEIEYMPPTAIAPDYEPLFDMPDLKAFGQAVISLTHSYWPKDEIDVLSTIQDDEIIDARFNQPLCHDLSILDPPEDNPFPVRNPPADSKKSETRGRSTSISGRSGASSTIRARPASVADVRTDTTSRAPSRTSSRPTSTILTRAGSAANIRPSSTVPPKSDASSSQTTKGTSRRPGTSLGIRPAESTARVAGKMMVPKRAETKIAQQPEPQSYLVEALATAVGESALDGEFLFEV